MNLANFAGDKTVVLVVVFNYINIGVFAGCLHESFYRLALRRADFKDYPALRFHEVRRGSYGAADDRKAVIFRLQCQFRFIISDLRGQLLVFGGADIRKIGCDIIETAAG